MPPRAPKPPSQTWRAFLKNHMHNTCAMDFFVIPTATFKILFALVILSRHRRKVVHFNVTTNPSAKWTSQQLVGWWQFPGRQHQSICCETEIQYMDAISSGV
jgi:hypothetical protein